MTGTRLRNVRALEAALAASEARATAAEAQIASLTLMIEKLRRALYGRRSERSERLLNQLELALDELEASATEDALAAEKAAAETTEVKGVRPAQAVAQALPRSSSARACGGAGTCVLRVLWIGAAVQDRGGHHRDAGGDPAPVEGDPDGAGEVHLPRLRADLPAAGAVPRDARGWAGPNLLATILFEKYGQHQPLNRQRDRYAREGIDLSVSTLADQVGACAVALRPMHDLIEAHVLAAGRLHGDDTPVPVLAKGKTDTGRAWVYVRDDKPFCGPDPPAALFRYSRDRSGDHPVEHLRTFTGILQADAYAGYRRLYEPGRLPGPVTEALCWSHGRRKFYELADIAANKRHGKSAPPISPLALEAVTRIDAIFDIERTIRGESAARRLAVRRERSAPLVAELEDWMRTERAGLSRHADVAKAMDYMLKRWDGFTRFLDDGRICLTNNAAERALRGIALGRKSWLFAGSDRGGERAAVIYTLIGTAKLNDVDPQAWLADVLARIAEQPQTRLHELLPWHWKAERQQDLAA